MAGQYSSYSPYYTTPVTGSYLDIANIRDVPALTDDTTFTITSQYENRPDLLAYDLYGDSRLWWVFAARNKNIIKDPIYDMIAGVTIYLPQPTTLFSSLGA